MPFTSLVAANRPTTSFLRGSTGFISCLATSSPSPLTLSQETEQRISPSVEYHGIDPFRHVLQYSECMEHIRFAIDLSIEFYLKPTPNVPTMFSHPLTYHALSHFLFLPPPAILPRFFTQRGRL